MMTPEEHAVLDLVVGRYLAGVASAEDVARLNAELSGNCEFARSFVKACRLDTMLTEHYQNRSAEVPEWMETQIGAPGSKTVRRLQPSIRTTPATNRFRWMWSPLAAAGCRTGSLHVWRECASGEAIRKGGGGTGGRWRGDSGKNSEFRIQNESNSENNKTQLRVGDIINIGDEVKVGADGKIKLAYADGSEIELQRNTTVALGAARGVRLFGLVKEYRGKWIRLDAGRLVAQVAKQKAGQEMVLTTPHAKATVMGTKFTLDEKADRTILNVQEGTVRLTELTGGGKEIDVTAGYFAEAGIEMIARRMRTEDGLLALYVFDEGSGRVVHDVSGVGEPADMKIANTNLVEWCVDGLRVKGAANISLAAASAKIDKALRENKAVTLELWFKEGKQIGSGDNVRYGQLTVEDSALSYRDGLSSDAIERLRHLVIVYDETGKQMADYQYENGVKTFEESKGQKFLMKSGHFMLRLSPLCEGRTIREDKFSFRSWTGEYCKIAIYGRVVPSEEIRTIYAAGLGQELPLSVPSEKQR